VGKDRGSSSNLQRVFLSQKKTICKYLLARRRVGKDRGKKRGGFGVEGLGFRV